MNDSCYAKERPVADKVELMERLMGNNIEQTQKRVLHIIIQCITDIQKTLELSDINMDDIGLGIEISQTTCGYYVELLLHQYANREF
jgi:hypothetical protein